MSVMRVARGSRERTPRSRRLVRCAAYDDSDCMTTDSPFSLKRTTIIILLLSSLVLSSIFSISHSLQVAALPAIFQGSQAFFAPIVANLPYKTNQAEDVKGIGACLIIMDDNHILPEWLAYHYQRLPLRRLIVGVDPKSKTSPTPTFDRYRKYNLMNITEWKNDVFYPLEMKNPSASNLDDHHLRQELFMASCLKQLSAENYTWTTVHDTDEFVVFNPMVDSSHQLQTVPSKPDLTILDILEASNNTWWTGEGNSIRNYTNGPCRPMRRFEMATMEYNIWEPIGLDTDFPIGGEYSMSDFLTYRYVYPLSNAKRPGKNLLDLSRVDPTDFEHINANPHRTLKPYCDTASIWLNGYESPLAMFHYTGTLEQYMGRVHDGRNKRNVADYQKKMGPIYPLTMAAQGWLQNFVESVGEDIAIELLEGVGKLEEWQKWNGTVAMMKPEIK